MTITKRLWTEFSSIQFWERQRLKGKRDKAISVTFDLLKSAIRSCVHDHNIFILFPNLSLNPLSPPRAHLCLFTPLRPTSLHEFSVFILYHSSLESFSVFPSLFSTSPPSFLSRFISGSPGSSQDPCKEHVSHDTPATNAINKLSNRSRERERECVQ